MRLESGPAAYDRNYYLIFLGLCLALGAYFYYDYTIGYPNKNLEEARRRLALLPGGHDVPDEFSQTPTKSTFEALKESQPTTPAAVRQTLGEPFAVNQEADRTFEYYVSAYGIGEVPIVRGQVDWARMTWTTWSKTAEEIKIQLYCALIAFAIGLYVLYRVYKATTLRVVIDDEGMTYAGRRIPFDSMTRLCDYSRKGWVDLYYQHGGQQRKLRIDNQKVRKFDGIINALCEVKGFEDPRKADEEEAESAAAEPTATSPEASEGEEPQNRRPEDETKT
jgi:hypothetical protein